MNRLGMTHQILTASFVAGLMFTMGTALTGCLTEGDSKTSNTSADSAAPFGAATVVDVGAQGNTTLGSALDLDSKKVLLSKDALAAQGTLDLVFIFSGGDLQIASPKAAKDAGDVPLATAYDATKIKDTQIARVSTKPENSGIAATTFEYTPKSNMISVTFGGDFLVKTSEGKIAYVKVDEVTGSDNKATAKITIALSAL